MLPSFIGPLLPFLLIIAGFSLNFRYNNSNEIIILKQYFPIKKNLTLFSSIFFFISIFHFFNNEILSVNLYQKYKVQELEIRNNLKLGLPSVHEFHIENEVSIFFEKQKNNKFYSVNAIIYKDGQFINSKEANIEIQNKNYNIIFYDGERVILKKLEKSKTTFDKFTYSIKNNEIETLMYDKEHFNTLELLDASNKEFFHQGHNRIYQYFLIFVIIIISFKVFFIYASKKNIFKFYAFIFFGVLILQLINSYLIFLLNNNNLNLISYYLINISFIMSYFYLIFKLNENN